MSIFTVRTNLSGSEGANRYFYIETGHASVADLLSDLRGGPILCTKLRATYDRDSNKMVVSDRKEFAIGAGLVVTIEEQTLPFVDAVGQAA